MEDEGGERKWRTKEVRQAGSGRREVKTGGRVNGEERGQGGM